MSDLLDRWYSARAEIQFRARVKEEKELRQDARDFETQESRGNRVSYASTWVTELAGVIGWFVFLAVFILFVYNKIILVYGW